MKKLWPVLLLLAAACKQKEYNADLIVKNALVYTVDSTFSTANAFVVSSGKITAVGDIGTLEKKYLAREVIDAGGKAVYPGFIDAHAHFYEYGLGLQNVNLVGLKSWTAIVDTVNKYASHKTDGWIIGGGWDQNIWDNKAFPNKAKLDSLFPVRPVILNRIDGHAAIANQAALNIAGVKPGQKIIGGEVETINGKLTGILVDNAVGIVTRKIPEPTEQLTQAALLDAQRNCFAVGLTTVDDCGLPYTMISTIAALQHKGDLKMRMYVMLADQPANYEYLFKRGAYKTPGLNVRSFKVYADGALGSRGACLLHPYADQKNWNGFLLSSKAHFEEVAKKIAAKGFQMCTHAIGDSANRVILKIYAENLKGKNNKRWRIEHAQIVSPDDIKMFGANNIIPSVQPTHATSDMAWAVKRLGADRLKTGYAYKSLMKQNGWIPLGTDFPVENINPMYTFYAATERKNLQGQPAGGFQMDNALSRIEALRGMTMWAAKANFEEKEKGSIEVGKYADFVILDQDIMKTKGSNLPNVKVLKTYINGVKVYEKK
ncbi:MULTISPECIES: amidohydrolase [unclassified Mucilaginibacter]|uniref:amidohydrolase n=2 Tax=Bacteria TaxID=2 RepID=UPI002AC9AA68|nr:MULTISPECIES: amidohydrolase [unclassified Mucilaginibacter]MEB0261633.1 amidohydrolase [Mucilaginibacter sp. 10I4]MEB0278498.1 amidohydrolase [Mucilaginibacter sp. 10B2]MEB0300718.1 amidohydrolase [Mucilaginibacter sp. 5C4]WPX23546.1 amidohydrolase [Mucilaginibacter sp. 5C4]